MFEPSHLTTSRLEDLVSYLSFPENQQHVRTAYSGNFSGILWKGCITVSLPARNSTPGSQIFQTKFRNGWVFSETYPAESNRINNALTITSKNFNTCTFLTITHVSPLSYPSETRPFPEWHPVSASNSKPNFHLGSWMLLKVRMQKDKTEGSVPAISSSGIDACYNVVSNQNVIFGLRRQLKKLNMYTSVLK